MPAPAAVVAVTGRGKRKGQSGSSRSSNISSNISSSGSSTSSSSGVVGGGVGGDGVGGGGGGKADAVDRRVWRGGGEEEEEEERVRVLQALVMKRAGLEGEFDMDKVSLLMALLCLKYTTLAPELAVSHNHRGTASVPVWILPNH